MSRGNRITAGTNCHGCVATPRSVRVGERRSFVAAGSLRGLFEDAEETERRVTTNNAIVSSARPFHDIARDSCASERGG